jgi:dienelactone hydrolase
MPSALRAAARWETLAGVPALLVRPQASGAQPAPVVLWMHGRTAHKELDPGRYLRWLRAGIGTCAVDLPGHGERYDEALRAPAHDFEVVRRMIGEVDALLEVLRAIPEFDLRRAAIGGVSAGGMAALGRLCREHPFRCASVEATTGSWSGRWPTLPDTQRSEARRLDPIGNLDGWRAIPFQAFHSRIDQLVPWEEQRRFTDALLKRYSVAAQVDLVVYDETGAPYEHVGMGRMAADAKNRQAAFLRRWLVDDPPGTGL